MPAAIVTPRSRTSRIVSGSRSAQRRNQAALSSRSIASPHGYFSGVFLYSVSRSARSCFTQRVGTSTIPFDAIRSTVSPLRKLPCSITSTPARAAMSVETSFAA